MIHIESYADKDCQFYPTPESLVKEIAEGIDWNMIINVLEPSAGKGDIIKAVQAYTSENWKYHKDKEFDCIEIDPNLRAILKETTNRNVRVVHDDFLTFDSVKRYDLIFMNPPFKEGDKHLLKAISLQEKWGGSIVCILNAETLKNAYTDTRKTLLDKLEKYGAEITYKENAFSTAERKTDVEIAVVKMCITVEKQESDIYKRMKEAEQYEPLKETENTEIEVTDVIKQAVNQYKVEVLSSIELIKQFRALKPYITRSFSDSNSSSILRLSVGDNRYDDDVDINEYIKTARSKYWHGLLHNDKFMGKLTSKLREKYYDMITELVNYEFSEFNINRILIEAQSELKKGVEDAVMELFDKLTVEHSWYPECRNNRHYYNGWKTNIAHKVGKKSILPAHGMFNSWDRSRLDVRGAYYFLADLEKAFNYLDGNMTADVDLWKVIEAAEKNSKNIQCKYFKVTFYKKGTCHITYNDEKIIDKLNIYAARERKWLPPHYGKTAYKDMTADEKAVIDDFQGEKAYNEVIRNSQYYLNINTGNLLQITENKE